MFLLLLLDSEVIIYINQYNVDNRKIKENGLSLPETACFEDETIEIRF